MDFGKQELIEMAGRIAAMSDAYSYLSYHSIEDKELDFLLQFQNPLEVLADCRCDYQVDTCDEMGFALDNIFHHKQDWLDNYTLMKDSTAPEDTGLRRFMGVDLISFLGKIAEKVVIHYPNDWNIDINELKRYAVEPDFEERRLVWHVCSFGTHLKLERNVFIRDSGAHEYMTDYRQNDPDMFGYYVEVTGMDGERITGNVYEVGDYADFAVHIRLTAIPLNSVTLTYADDWGVNAGKVLTVSREEYDDNRQRLMCESGNVIDILHHPKNAQELDSKLHDERSYRMSLPIGSMEAHLSKLTEKLAKVRKPPEKTPEAHKPPEKAVGPTALQKKQSITERLTEAGEEARAYNAQRAQNITNTTKKQKKEID